MNIDLSEYSIAYSKLLQDQLINQFFTMNSHPPASSSPWVNLIAPCAKPEPAPAPAPAPKPAERIAINAVKNGWMIDVDFNKSYCSNTALPQFVYTKPQEVAGAVLGLITCGIPLSGVCIPHETREEQAHREVKLRQELAVARAEGFVQCQKQANESLDKLKEAAYHDGYSMGQRNANEAFESRKAAECYRKGVEDSTVVYGKLRSEIDTLNARLSEAKCEAQTARRSVDMVKQDSYRHGFSAGQIVAKSEAQHIIDDKSKLLAQHEETHRKFQTEISEQAAKISDLQGRINTVQERINTAYENGVNAGRSQLFASTKPEPDFRVGDVWRTPDGHIRCIAKIIPTGWGEKACYSHKDSDGVIRNDSSLLVDFSYIVSNGSVTRDAFTPACHPDEPAEGFCVGDVWKINGSSGYRIITRVSAAQIDYDYRFDLADTEVYNLEHRRGSSMNRPNRSANLTRK